MASKKSKDRKYELADELKSNFDEYKNVFIVDVDNVGSNQLHEIRKCLRGVAQIYCGKNTQMRRVLRELEEDRPELEKIRACLKLNVALVFTNDSLPKVRDLITENKQEAQAKAGALAQCDVWIMKGLTQLEPTQTSFLQALNIGSKITKGNIEIINDVQVLYQGVKIDASQAVLLQKMNMTPFKYGLVPRMVFDGNSCFAPEVLDIEDSTILGAFSQALKNTACVSLVLNMPTVASVPYSILLAFADLLAVAAETEFTFKEAEKIKAYLADPSAFACAGPAVAATGGNTTAAAPAAAESSDDDDGGAAAGPGLFGDDGGDDY